MKGLLLLLILLPSLTAQEPDTFPIYSDTYTVGNSHEYAEFITEIDKFNRKLGGCPPKGPLDTCNASRGEFDVKLWKDLQKRAYKIFHLPRVPTNK